MNTGDSFKVKAVSRSDCYYDGRVTVTSISGNNVELFFHHARKTAWYKLSGNRSLHAVDWRGPRIVIDD